MAESDRRNPGTSRPTRINGAVASSTQSTNERTIDGKYRFVERLSGDASVSFSRERVFDRDLEIADQFGNLLVITTSGRDDTILIDQRKDGTLDINVNGKQFLVALGATQELAIRSYGGDDRIIASSKVTANLLVDSGGGNDIIITGDGDDHVLGGADNDTVVTRDGNDYFFGDDGDDVADLGDGDDIGYGGNHDDTLWGNNGSDYLDGGKGYDRLHDRSDWNVLTSGSADNPQDRGTGRTYSEEGIDPKLGSSIKIVGTAAFRQRVESDLDTLRSSPAGQRMLAVLDLAAKTKGNSVTITELTHHSNGIAIPNGNGDPYLSREPESVVSGSGADTTVQLNPSYGGTSGKPIIVLFHELSHAYNMVTGTLQPGIYAGPGVDRAFVIAKRVEGIDNSERQAVGLPNTGLSFDFDGNPDTPPTNDNPRSQTENGLRAEMGLQLRQSYRVFVGSSGQTGLRSDPDLNSMMEALLAGDSVAFQRAVTEFGGTPYAQQALDQAAAMLDAQRAEPAIEPTNTIAGPKIR